jgi:hypothetical protein
MPPDGLPVSVPVIPTDLPVLSTGKPFQSVFIQLIFKIQICADFFNFHSNRSNRWLAVSEVIPIFVSLPPVWVCPRLIHWICTPTKYIFL